MTDKPIHEEVLGRPLPMTKAQLKEHKAMAMARYQLDKFRTDMALEAGEIEDDYTIHL